MLIEVEKKLDKAFLSKDHFIKMKLKRDVALRNAYYIRKLSDETMNNFQGDIMKVKLLNRQKRILDCMKLWYWDYYRKNKIMDLKKVWRCGDIYCPNCRTVNIAIQISNFRKYFDDMVEFGYMPYFLTLTIPNIQTDDIYNKITLLNNSFYKLWQWLSNNDSHGFKNRMFDLKACVRMLEFTINKDSRMCHLHIHSILFIDRFTDDMFCKEIPSYYSNKKEETVMLSTADIEMAKLWTMAVNENNISKYNKMPDDWVDYFKCDIRPLDLQKGIYEVFKYSFKDNDLIDYNIFRDVFFGFRGKRIRQSYGKIYKFNLEVKSGFEITKEMPLINEYLDFEEVPELIKTYGFQNLIDSEEIKKISRFKAFKEYLEIKE